MLIRSCD